MKKIYLALFAIALAFAPTISINAQFDGGGAPMGPPPGGRQGMMKPKTVEERTAEMAKTMELNEEQTAQLKALNEKYQSTFQMPRMRPDQMPDSLKNLSREERMAKMRTQFDEMRKQREAFNAELKALVGDEKYAKYEEQQKSRRQNFSRRPRNN